MSLREVNVTATLGTLTSSLYRRYSDFTGPVEMDSPSPPPEDAPPPPPASSSSGSPTDFLKAVVGKRVVVRLVSGVDYRGAEPL
jgi:hypothetical protein